MDVLRIADNVVIEVMSVDSIDNVRLLYPDCVFLESDGIAGAGWQYINGDLIQGNVVSTTDLRITNLAFLNRFTDDEAIAVDLASQGATEGAARLRRFQKKIDAAKFIDLDSPDLYIGINVLESVGLIGAGRADEIMSRLILPHERFTE